MSSKKYKIGDWVLARVWKPSFSETIKTIVTNDTSPWGREGVQVAWMHNGWLDSLSNITVWWVSTDPNTDRDVGHPVHFSSYGCVLGKVCPNTIPKCLKNKYASLNISK